MFSTMPQKRPAAGFAKCHSAESRRDRLTREALAAEPASRHTKPGRRIPWSSMREKQSAPALSSMNIHTSSGCMRRKATDDWLSPKSFSHIQAVASAESHEADLIAQSLLNTEHNFVKELDKYLLHRDVLELRKKELLYKKWSESVSEPLQQKLEKLIESQSAEDIENRKCLLLSKYLDYCNKKGYVFLEDYNHREYNPFVLQLRKPHYFKVVIPALDDPLLLQSRERAQVEGTILQCQTGKVYSAWELEELHKPKQPLVPLGRQDDSNTWVRMPLGFIDSEVRQKSMQKMRGVFNCGTLNFEVWSKTCYPPTIFDEEMQVCHKRKFPKLTAPQGIPTAVKQGPAEQPTQLVESQAGL